MLASTVKFSTYNRHPTPAATYRHDLGGAHDQKKLAPPTNACDSIQDQVTAGWCCPILQDPTTCQTPHPTTPSRSTAKTSSACTSDEAPGRCQVIDVPPL